MPILRCKCDVYCQKEERDDWLTFYLLPVLRQPLLRTVFSVRPLVPGFPCLLPLWYVSYIIYIDMEKRLTCIYSSSRWE